MNAPLPTYDMMTGKQIVDVQPVSANAASMLANHSDVVHVQLLDRMVVVPEAIVNGPFLRSKITSPDGQGPIDQHSQAYLLFVDWKNFHPLLEYMCGNPVQLPSDKGDLLQLKNTARKFQAREFERLVTRHLRQLHGGSCAPFACMHMPRRAQKQAVSAQFRPHSNPAAAAPQRSAPMQQESEPIQAAAPQAASAADTQPGLERSKATRFHVQMVMPTSSGTSMFKKAPRPAKHQKAGKDFAARQNQLYMDVHTQQPVQYIYDRQQPLIV